MCLKFFNVLVKLSTGPYIWESCINSPCKLSNGFHTWENYKIAACKNQVLFIPYVLEKHRHNPFKII